MDAILNAVVIVVSLLAIWWLLMGSIARQLHIEHPGRKLFRMLRFKYQLWRLRRKADK